MDEDATDHGYKVVLSPLAVQDLVEIVTFIAADNPAAANRFGHALVQKTRLLTRFPELGRVVPELGSTEGARELIHRAYRVIYRVDHARRKVEVSRFWHSARGTPLL